MYFKAMPTMVYRTPAGDDRIVRDIFKRVFYRGSITGQLSMDSYYVKNYETPEIIASKLYNNPQYHWIILMANNIVDIPKEWPKSPEVLDAYVTKKYGAGNEQAIHHYRITGSDPEVIVDYDAASVTAGTHESVTNYDYEIALNEDKKQIKILKKEFVAEFVIQYKRLMASQNG